MGHAAPVRAGRADALGAQSPLDFRALIEEPTPASHYAGLRFPALMVGYVGGPPPMAALSHGQSADSPSRALKTARV